MRTTSRRRQDDVPVGSRFFLLCGEPRGHRRDAVPAWTNLLCLGSGSQGSTRTQCHLAAIISREVALGGVGPYLEARSTVVLEAKGGPVSCVNCNPICCNAPGPRRRPLPRLVLGFLVVTDPAGEVAGRGGTAPDV